VPAIALEGRLTRCRSRQDWSARRFVQATDGGLGSQSISASVGIAVRRGTRVAGIEQNDASPRLDPIGDIAGDVPESQPFEPVFRKTFDPGSRKREFPVGEKATEVTRSIWPGKERSWRPVASSHSLSVSSLLLPWKAVAPRQGPRTIGGECHRADLEPDLVGRRSSGRRRYRSLVGVANEVFDVS
jgi:hypothetical protein